MKKNSDVQFNQIKSIFEKAGDLENLLNEQIIQESKKKLKNLSGNQSLNLFQLLTINLLYRQSTKNKLYHTPFLHLREFSPITTPIFLKFLFKKSETTRIVIVLLESRTKSVYMFI